MSYDDGLVHTYRDPSSEFKYRIVIKDAPKQTTVWTVIGVDEDNWRNEYAPGKDCMSEFAPGPYYDPTAQVNVLCAGKQVDDAMCPYLFDVARTRQQNSNSVIFIGAGVPGRSSWLDRQIVENFEKINFTTDTPGGRSSWGAQVIVEVPQEAQLHGTISSISCCRMTMCGLAPRLTGVPWPAVPYTRSWRCSHARVLQHHLGVLRCERHAVH